MEKQMRSTSYGVSVTSDPQAKDGKICLSVYEPKVQVVILHVKNYGDKSFNFTFDIDTKWKEYFTLRDDSGVSQGKQLKLKQGQSYTINILFQSEDAGFYHARLNLGFMPDLPSIPSFDITNVLEIKMLASIAPFKRRPIPRGPVRCFKPERRATPKWKKDLKSYVPLKEYKVPHYVKLHTLVKLLEDNSVPRNSWQRNVKALLKSPLSMKNYSYKFKWLLYIEELQRNKDIKQYNMVDVSMSRDPSRRDCLILQVPDVSQNCPFLRPGDQLVVTPSEVSEGSKSYGYEVYVFYVENDQVFLHCHRELVNLFTDNMKFNVEFTVDRFTIRIQHRAAELVSGLRKVLFPTGTSFYKQTEVPTFSPFNSHMTKEQNLEQYTAVQHILAGSSRPAPYLVFGSPGTGKTSIVVEAIKQIDKSNASCHILACCHTNSAADRLCIRLLENDVEVHKVYRMYAVYHKGAKPQELQKCCNKSEDDLPTRKELMQYTIVVTTLLNASRLVTKGIHQGHFTHIFVDEAGHTVETECIIPLAGLLDPFTSLVVLTGDPKQLGPIVKFSQAHKLKMDVSLLERLMDIDLYKKDKSGAFNNRFLTKLLKNYRSHSAILEIPNELFYERELQYMADKAICNSYYGWQHLPTKDFPLIFHAVASVEEREGNSLSFFNLAEVEVLMQYVVKLLEKPGKGGRKRTHPEDIGILALYKKQVEKIRKALQEMKTLPGVNMDKLKVGTVDEFQGEQKKVILLSTVRNSTICQGQDQMPSLNFIGNEKRFNVAVTRAQALLIVVGDPKALEQHLCWARFIDYCKKNKGYLVPFLQAEE
ncbi:putative helicase mov-10-B.2 [Lampris incognitus]|uniref:putative helicase mov-10-B.2 n=1 Tax=Lampris incognitus TaxID=2546036 RepID=UPI0024B62D2A|nr:putative helicase mov-10-B.2 [Lampris incognitus]